MSKQRDTRDRNDAPRRPRTNEDLPWHKRRRVRITIVILTVLSIIVICGLMSSIFAPVMISLALAYIFDPVICWLETRRIRRWVGVSIVYLIIIGLMCLGLIIFVPKIVNQTGKLYQTLVAKAKEFGLDVPVQPFVPGASTQKPLHPAAPRPHRALPRAPQPAAARPQTDTPKGAQAVPAGTEQPRTAEQNAPDTAEPDKGDGGILDPGALRNVLQKHASEIAVKAGGLFYTGVQKAFAGISNVLAFFVNTVLVALYTFFFMLGFSRMKNAIEGYLPGAHRARILEILGEIDRSVANFFRGRLIISLISATVTSLGLSLLAGIDYWLLIGIAAGVLGFIPFVGIIVPLVPAVAFAILTPDPAWSLIWVVATFGFVQGVVEPVVGMRVMSKEVNLHPVTIIISLLVGGKLFGMFGAILSVPMAAAAKILGREFLLPPIEDLANEGRDPTRTESPKDPDKPVAPEPTAEPADSASDASDEPAVPEQKTEPIDSLPVEEPETNNEPPVEETHSHFDATERAAEIFAEVRERMSGHKGEEKDSGGRASRDNRGGRSRPPRRGPQRRRRPPGVDGPMERPNEFMSDDDDGRMDDGRMMDEEEVAAPEEQPERAEAAEEGGGDQKDEKSERNGRRGGSRRRRRRRRPRSQGGEGQKPDDAQSGDSPASADSPDAS